MAKANGKQQDPQPEPEAAQELDHKKPVYKARLGRVLACVWQNEGANGTYHTVTVARLYKPEGSDVWCQASSFGRDDLPLVAKVCDAAHSWIFAAQQGGDVPF